MENTCRFGKPNAPIEVLGSFIGDVEARAEQFQQKIDKLTSLHGAISQLDDAQVELTLGRVSGGVARVIHLLRTNGLFLSPDVVGAHDRCQAAFLSHVLAGDLSETSVSQASAGVQQGGLGMRRASQLRALAFVSSRVEVRPFVARLFGEMASAGVSIPGCLDRYDRQTVEALNQFVNGLDDNRAQRAKTICERASVHAQARLDAYLEGSEVCSGAPVGNGHAGDRLVNGEVPDDPEHPRAPSRIQLQHALAHLADRHDMGEAIDSFERAGRREDFFV